MQLRNWKNMEVFYTPQILLGKLIYLSSCLLTKREIFIFNHALEYLARFLVKDKYTHDQLTLVSCVFSNSDRFDFEFGITENTVAMYSPIIFYRVNRWRKAKYNDEQMLAIFLEELCHCQYHIENEITVKHKVFEIVHHFHPEVSSMDDLKL